MAFEGLPQRGKDGAAQRVALIRPIDGDREASPGGFDDEVRIRHGDTASTNALHVLPRRSLCSASIGAMRWTGPATAMP